MQRGAIIVPTKDRIEWPYVALLIAIVLMVAAALQLSVVGLGRLGDLRRFVGWFCDMAQQPPMICHDTESTNEAPETQVRKYGLP